MSSQPGPPSNRYEFRPGQSGPGARRRLLIIYFALVALAGISLMVHFVLTNQMNRWLQERPGPAVVLEKLAPGDTTPSSGFALRIQVLVPEATPEEAALLPEDYPDRENAIGPQELEDVVETPEADWASVDVGTRLRASYQINIRRTKVAVRALYLDRLNPEAGSARDHVAVAPHAAIEWPAAPSASE
jgi:hypothetical protein